MTTQSRRKTPSFDVLDFALAAAILLGCALSANMTMTSVGNDFLRYGVHIGIAAVAALVTFTAMGLSQLMYLIGTEAEEDEETTPRNLTFGRRAFNLLVTVGIAIWAVFMMAARHLTAPDDEPRG